MEIEGKIYKVLEPLSGVSQRTGNTWKSQDYVLQYYWYPNQQNPSFLTFRVFGADRIDQFNLKENDEVKVSISIEAHEYNGRWFNEIRAHAVTFVGASTSKNPAPFNGAAAEGNQPAADPSTGSGTASEKPAASDEANKPADPADDLPF